MENKRLRQIPVESIRRNEDNPRIFFRDEEMDRLLVSIKSIGVQVPIVVYVEREKYVLIDGERRWRTCKKLNLQTIPAIVQDKPSALENLLIMFNIHALREQWDLFTISNKVTRIMDLLSSQLGRLPNELELSQKTGLNRGTIRRCKLLIELPQEYKDVLLRELEKPKLQQKLTEDFFIEMEKSLKTVAGRFPESLVDKDAVRHRLMQKYQAGVIGNVLDFRKLSKLATSPANLDYPVAKVRQALRQIFEGPNASIADVFDQSVSSLYTEKQLLSTINSVVEELRELRTSAQIDEELIEVLRRARDTIDGILSEWRG